ncbi:retrotransposon protein, putative, ty1-copia subclass [Tanacetum coccineum]|uniref:Retrotransposon protein, putative, ty1-copia subclass n=1 Tax=Tanacetum coccineum TaxID=301880 RepID=A0ABQ5HSW0_9ASTR
MADSLSLNIEIPECSKRTSRIRHLQFQWYKGRDEEESMSAKANYSKDETRGGNRAEDLLGLIHIDLCGPFQVPTRDGDTCFVTFTDDFSRYGYVYLSTHKHEVFKTFVTFQRAVENQLDKNIKSLRSDRGVKRTTPNKLESRAIKCKFVGYPKEIARYSFYYPEEYQVFVERNGQFLESDYMLQEFSGSDKILDEIKHASNLPDRYFGFLMILEAMNAEIHSIKDNEVWDLVDLPLGTKVVGCKWVLKNKTDMDGNELFKPYSMHIEKSVLKRFKMKTSKKESWGYCPDMSYALSMTSKFQSDPKEEHWTVVKAILTYLRRIKDTCLLYGGLEDDLSVKAYWMKKFKEELKVVPSKENHVKVYCDNSTISLQNVEVIKVHTNDNTIDPLTKALPCGKHEFHANGMGLRYIGLD